MSETIVRTFKYIDLEEMYNEHEDTVALSEVADYLMNEYGPNDFNSVEIDKDVLENEDLEPEMRFVLTYLWNEYKHLFDDQTVVIYVPET